MNFELSESQEMLRSSVRRFLQEQASIDGYVRPRIDDEAPVCDEVWRGLAGLGLHGLLVPEERGGGDLGMVEMGIVCEELGRAVYPGPFAATALACVSLLRLANDETAATVLTRVARGEVVAAAALYEPAEGPAWRRSRLEVTAEVTQRSPIHI